MVWLLAFVVCGAVVLLGPVWREISEHITRGDLLEAVVFFRSHFYSCKPHPLRHSSEGKERKNDVRGVVYETTTFFGILLLEKKFFYLPTYPFQIC